MFTVSVSDILGCIWEKNIRKKQELVFVSVY